MNVVGKIFTVLVFVMSICFASFSLMVLAAHTDWRNKVIATEGLSKQLIEANKEKKEAVELKKQLEAKLLEEKDRYVKRLAALEQVKGDLTKERKSNDNLLAKKQDDLSKIVERDPVDSHHARFLARGSREDACRYEDRC